MKSIKKLKSKRCYCYKCRHETNQIITFETINFDTTAVYHTKNDSPAGWVVVKTIWSFSKCKGCDSNNLEIITYHIGSNEIEREVDRELLPGKPKRHVEDWIFGLDEQYIELLSEIYSALNNGNFRLSMMGARTVIDMFIVESIGDIGSFQQKLKALVDKNFISNEQFEMLNTSIEAGNASAHRGYKPSEEALTSVIDVIENLLKPRAMQTKVSNIKNEIPKRGTH